MWNFRFSKNFLLILLSIFGISSINSFDILFSKALAEEKNNSLTLEKSSDKNIFVSEDIYILGPGDVLSFEIIDLNNFVVPEEIIILNDGSVNLPFIGSVKISGLTLMEATKYIELQLNKELKR